MWAIPTDTSSHKKKSGKESQYMFSHPETGSNPPIWSDRESGCDKLVSEPRFRRFWISLILRMYLHDNVLV